MADAADVVEVAEVKASSAEKARRCAMVEGIRGSVDLFLKIGVNQVKINEEDLFLRAKQKDERQREADAW